ncbi:MAG TPA: hypothetical protein VFR49_02665, partial [Solirubrobacteraceae bacterium]|nr:hypothetical protein [Solirubrobacteraceae bacterium]
MRVLSPSGPPFTAPAARRHPSPAGASRIRRVAAVAATLVLAAGLMSYALAMTQPSNSSVAVRSVEWLRDHGGAGLVSRVESVFYSLTAPSTGGPALRALPRTGYDAAGGGGGGSATAPAPAAGAAARPADIPPLVGPGLPGEGVWRSTSPVLGAADPVLVTTFRSDPVNYPRLVAGVAWIDTARTVVRLYPGRQEPSVPLADRGPMAV